MFEKYIFEKDDQSDLSNNLLTAKTSLDLILNCMIDNSNAKKLQKAFFTVLIPLTEHILNSFPENELHFYYPEKIFKAVCKFDFAEKHVENLMIEERKLMCEYFMISLYKANAYFSMSVAKLLSKMAKALRNELMNVDNEPVRKAYNDLFVYLQTFANETFLEYIKSIQQKLVKYDFQSDAVNFKDIDSKTADKLIALSFDPKTKTVENALNWAVVFLNNMDAVSFSPVYKHQVNRLFEKCY